MSKRPRTPQEEILEASERLEDEEEEPSPKIARLPEEGAATSNDGVDTESLLLPELPEELPQELPLAPKLKDYLAPGGTRRYRPRPEWYQPIKIKGGVGRQHNNPHPHHHQRHAHVSPEANNPIAIVPNARHEHPGLLVAPEDGLLPPGAFQHYQHAEAAATHTSAPRTRLPTETSPKVALATPPEKSSRSSSSSSPHRPCVFGKDWDHALHVAVRENATDAAIALLNHGAPLQCENAKRFTPLILAAQKGNAVLVRELLRRGADPASTTLTGVSAALQASHFGHCEVLSLLLQAGSSYLVEIANYNHTTPLMRASQEGHVEIVKLLLQAGSAVNRRNRAHLTALMLASQRGHAQICQLLIDYGAELDAMTRQNSTSLLLACKRGNADVVRVLVTAGCELAVKDSRGRTVREVAHRKNQKELIALLDPAVQIDLMQRQGRRQRNFEMIRMWRLLQKERANVPVPDQPELPALSIHQVAPFLQQEYLPYALTVKSTTALLYAMTLPEPLVESIAKFLPLPTLWERRLGMLLKRAAVNADDAVIGAFDLVDEILEEGGFLDACDTAQVTPMPHFSSWAEWKAWGRQRGGVAPERNRATERIDITSTTCPPPQDPNKPTYVELRRHAGYLQILAHRSPLLEQTLARPPYKMPRLLIEKLIQVSDVASLTRRMGPRGIHFDTTVAMDLVMMASQLCSWYWRERDIAST